LRTDEFFEKLPKVGFDVHFQALEDVFKVTIFFSDMEVNFSTLT